MGASLLINLMQGNMRAAKTLSQTETALKDALFPAVLPGSMGWKILLKFMEHYKYTAPLLALGEYVLLVIYSLFSYFI
jgi:hypothetical protein